MAVKSNSSELRLYLEARRLQMQGKLLSEIASIMGVSRDRVIELLRPKY